MLSGATTIFLVSGFWEFFCRGLRLLGLALGYEDLNDHDELRDTTLGAEP
jgi:hypothetical protein